MSRFEKPAQFGGAYAQPAPGAAAIKTLVLLAALLAYAAGFVLLHSIVAGSVANSVSDGADPALTQFVGP